MQTFDLLTYRESQPMPGMEDSYTEFSGNSSFLSANSNSFSSNDFEQDKHAYDRTEQQKEVKRLAKGQAAHNMRQLPEDYALSDFDVICGRGRRCFNHVGNQRFRKIVADMLPKYSDASAKLEKTIIICEVVNAIRRASPEGGFVKKDPMTGRYFEVGDFLAREKTSQAFRDALADQYKSSNSAKKKRRLKDMPDRLHKQLSAPLLNRTAIQESSEDILLDQQSQASSRSSASRYSNATWSNGAQPEYAVNNSKFMRVEPNMDLLLGELDTALSLNLNGNDKGQGCIKGKRDIFQSQRSATSVIDEAQGMGGAVQEQTPAWFNRSCPDFSYDTNSSASSVVSRMSIEPNGQMSSMLNQVQELVEEEEEEEEPLGAEQFSIPNMYADWHHSTPNLFSSDHTMNFLDNHNESPPSSSHQTSRFQSRPNLMMLSPKKRSQSVRHLNMGQASSFSVYHSPEKGANRRVNHEDIVLSPIGDGTTEDLFDKLQNIQEFSESGDGDGDCMEPIKIPF